MATRSLVSYDDITLPYQPAQHSRQPPPKKRKRSHQKSQHHHNGVSQENGSEDVFPEQNHYEDDEESRELTHEEIWDDSALVDAWEAATEEYEACHGSEKAWKTEPVNKAPLWYNIPVESSTSANPVTSAIPTEGAAEIDSQPINFDTFVPTHNPSLDHLSSSLAPPMDHATIVSQDEAFSRALNAMYWGGYWTAMYHCQRKMNVSSAEDDLAEDDDEDFEKYDAGDEENDQFISTQR